MPLRLDKHPYRVRSLHRGDAVTPNASCLVLPANVRPALHSNIEFTAACDHTRMRALLDRRIALRLR